MINQKRVIGLIALGLLVLPLAALALVEPKSETEYPDQILVQTQKGEATLKATGVGLREKTFMKVDVYTIVSYAYAEADLGEDPAAALLDLKAPKRLQMDLRRGFSKDKLVNSFKDVIEKNYEDTSAFAGDMDTFFAYFTRDAEEGDKLIFDYCPVRGLTTHLNGEEMGVIENFEFVKALWTVWFGEKPANGGLKKNLVGQVS